MIFWLLLLFLLFMLHVCFYCLCGFLFRIFLVVVALHDVDLAVAVAIVVVAVFVEGILA